MRKYPFGSTIKDTKPCWMSILQDRTPRCNPPLRCSLSGASDFKCPGRPSNNRDAHKSILGLQQPEPTIFPTRPPPNCKPLSTPCRRIIFYNQSNQEINKMEMTMCPPAHTMDGWMDGGEAPPHNRKHREPRSGKQNLHIQPSKNRISQPSYSPPE